MSESACQETSKERSVTYKSEKLTKSPKSNLNDSAADIISFQKYKYMVCTPRTVKIWSTFQNNYHSNFYVCLVWNV
jgi:hypothetical protein